MRLMVDEREVKLDRPTLAAAIAAGAGDAESRGRIVVEVKADGVTLAERDIESAPDIPGSFKEVALTTVSRGELAAGVLSAASAALGDLATAQRHVADQVLATRLEPAAAGLQEVISVWQGVREASDQVCVLLATDLSTLAESAGVGDQARAAVDGLAAALTGVRASVQAQDWSTLADLLTDELTDLASSWQTVLGAITASVYTPEG